jgi:hypothetical protein
MNEKKIEKALTKTMKVVNSHNLNIKEMILFAANLNYCLGASIEGIKKKGPNLETLKRQYYTSPTAGVSLMLQGLQMIQWADDYQEKKEEKK